MELALRTNCVGLLTAAKHVVPKMEAQGRGCVVVTGATAALRGKVRSSFVVRRRFLSPPLGAQPRTTAFAAAKAAQRSLTQSIAKKAMPNGVHVSYAIIDGAVGDGETRIDPDAIAETYYQITQQPKSCWTFELDVRPHVETW